MSLRPLSSWHVLSRTPLLERAYLRVRQDHVRLGDGREIDDFCVVESPDWAAVLCVTADGRVPLVRQYRHGLGQVSWELPAGALEPGEEPRHVRLHVAPVIGGRQCADPAVEQLHHLAA